MSIKLRMPGALLSVMCAAGVCAGVCAGVMAEDPTIQSYAPYPQPDRGYVTDIANLLTAEQEEQLEGLLEAREEESGLEMAVVTIQSINDYAGTDNGRIEAFATGLFNAYGIGNLPKNDGVLLLVAVADREARIELGSGYGTHRDAEMTGIMQHTIVPEFRNGRFDQGIVKGTRAILSRLAPAKAAAAAPPVEAVAPQPAQQPVEQAQPSLPAEQNRPIVPVRPNRPSVMPGRGGLSGLTCIGLFFFLAVMVALVIKAVSSVSGLPRSGPVQDDGMLYDVHRTGLLGGLMGGGPGISFGGRSRYGRHHGAGFFGGGHLGGSGMGLGGGHSHGGHRTGFGGHSPGGFGGGFGGGHSGGHSSFGGGHSGGGGASGKW